MSLLSASLLSSRRLHVSSERFYLRLNRPLASSMFAPAVPQLMAGFGSTNAELAAFVVSVYVLGFATGPLVIAPLSELYGRLYVYHITNILFIIFSVACAVSPSLSVLIGFRFLAGCAGAAPTTLGGGTIADVIPQEQRGAAMASYTLGMLLGPVTGPIVGGFLSEAKGWRWIFWILAIAVRLQSSI
jgi:multidrug resistance protein